MATYHYYATKHTNDQSVLHVDGIVKLQSPVQTMDDYRRLKALIANDPDIGGEARLIICSLTLLCDA